MKIVRYTTMITLLVIMIMAFTACGGDNSEPQAPATSPVTTAATPAPVNTTPDTATATAPDTALLPPTPAPATPAPETTVQPNVANDYLVAMDEFIEAFEVLIDFTFELIDMLELLETDDELMEWIEAFEIIKDSVAEAIIELDSASPYVPDEYLESHLLIVASVSLFLESMLELDLALAAGILGDDDAMWVGIDGFAINLAAAFALWDEALYGPVTHAPILIGTWSWVDTPEWVWIFNEDGTGSGGTPSAADNFVWETSNVFPWLNAVGGELWLDFGANNIQHWAFIVEFDDLPHVLILDSLQVEDVGFVYVRR